MDRKSLREFTHKAENFVSIDNIHYRQWVFRYTFLELEKDLWSKGDITSKSALSGKKNVIGRVIAKSDGVFAGGEEVKYFLVDSDPTFKPNLQGKFSLNFTLSDGDTFSKGDVLIEIEAEAHNLLAVERVVLNLLIRMCNVATFTREVVNLVKEYDVLITPTRKTLWGLIDKKAVFIGGGGTHRVNLSDAILVKENHLKILDRNYALLMSNIKRADLEARFVEIEVETGKEALEVGKLLSEAIESRKIRAIGAILFDNFLPSDLSNLIDRMKKTHLDENLLFEASGGITKENIIDYASTGVDIISMGQLTSGVSGVDLSMLIK